MQRPLEALPHRGVVVSEELAADHRGWGLGLFFHYMGVFGARQFYIIAILFLAFVAAWYWLNTHNHENWAILLAALILWGFKPGPMLIEDSPALFWGLVASMYIGNVLLLIGLLLLWLTPAWTRRLADSVVGAEPFRVARECVDEVILGPAASPHE